MTSIKFQKKNYYKLFNLLKSIYNINYIQNIIKYDILHFFINKLNTTTNLIIHLLI